MAVNIHITIIELNALHTKRQNLFQELDAVIHLLMEAKHWGLRKSRNATSLNSRFKSLDTLKVKIISVTFRRVIRTNHKKASKIWRHENIQLGGCQSRSEERFSRNAETDLVCRLLLEKKNYMKSALSLVLGAALVCAAAPASKAGPHQVLHGTQIHLKLLTPIH